MNMANSTNNNKTYAADLYQDHKRRIEGIQLSKALLNLMLEIQRHRAATLAYLGGDIFFENKLWSIQKTCGKIIDELNQETQGLLSKQEIHQLHGEWKTIRSQWQKDSIMQNFQLHSHLIEFILKINTGIAKQIGQAQLSTEYQALSDYGMSHLPQLIEVAAQARGLATHCAALQSNPEELTTRIGYLINSIQSKNERAESTIANSSTEYYQIIQQAKFRYKNDTYLGTFISQLQDHFSDNNGPQIQSEEIYLTGSLFITATHKLQQQATKLMSQHIDDGMKAWILNSKYSS